MDPFTIPCGCSCMRNPDVKPWLQCDDHGCCMVTAKMVWCQGVDECEFTRDFHRYTQSKTVIRSTWAAGCPSQTDLTTFYTTADRTWRHLAVLDQLLFQGQSMLHRPLPSLYLTALNNMLTTGRLIQTTKTTLSALQRGTKRMVDRHEYLCGEVCERVLNEWECPSIGPIQILRRLAKGMAHFLTRQIKICKANWDLLEAAALGEGDIDGLLLRDVVFFVRD